LNAARGVHMNVVMITMWMREQDCINVMNALPDQKRNDYFLAD
jgi:hypothetical protein